MLSSRQVIGPYGELRFSWTSWSHARVLSKPPPPLDSTPSLVDDWFVLKAAVLLDFQTSTMPLGRKAEPHSCPTPIPIGSHRDSDACWTSHGAFVPAEPQCSRSNTFSRISPYAEIKILPDFWPQSHICVLPLLPLVHTVSCNYARLLANVLNQHKGLSHSAHSCFLSLGSFARAGS